MPQAFNLGGKLPVVVKVLVVHFKMLLRLILRHFAVGGVELVLLLDEMLRVFSEEQLFNLAAHSFDLLWNHKSEASLPFALFRLVDSDFALVCKTRLVCGIVKFVYVAVIVF